MRTVPVAQDAAARLEGAGRSATQPEAAERRKQSSAWGALKRVTCARHVGWLPRERGNGSGVTPDCQVLSERADLWIAQACNGK